jgi:hypothetical protein
MWSLVKSCALFLWHRNSDAASKLLIGIAHYLIDRDLQQMSDYLESLRKSRQQQGESDANSK